jgi:serine/threonine protein kinase
VPASDVYSLGLVFSQLITGQPPRHDVEAVLAGKGPAIDTELLTAELTRAGSPNFMSDPGGAAEIIARMCAPQRSDRYATLREVLEDLAICEARPRSIVPDPATGRGHARRHEEGCHAPSV